MVKVSETPVIEEVRDNGVRVVKASLLSDTKAEVTMSTGEGIQGLEDTDILALGTTCFTAEQDFGTINSSGIWKW